jgi:sulfoxide reductase catalytic subunit YedY
MPTRRQLLLLWSRVVLWFGATAGLGFAGVSKVWAQTQKRILPKNTDLQQLRNDNPEALDTRNLEIMPIEAFETMGDKDAPFSARTWRLQVTGAVGTDLELTYDEILALPPLERKVLLVCPGVFVIHAKWKGFAIQELIEQAHSSPNVSKVYVYARSRMGDRKETFSIEDVNKGLVFLAYGVNDRVLPRKHGFPLRVVAEGYWGSFWAKYVYKVEFIV